MPKEKTYRVIWEIDVTAKSPKEAAIKALAIQRNPESTATIFKIDLNINGKTGPIIKHIDLFDSCNGKN